MQIRKARGDLIGAAAANTGKVFTESDVEVSEAIDFAEYYPRSARDFAEINTIRCRGKGRRRGDFALEFPDSDPLRRHRGFAGGRQYGYI